MEQKNRKILCVCLTVVALAILTAALIWAFSKCNNEPSPVQPTDDEQTIDNINDVVNDANTSGNFTIAQALGVLYSDNKNVISGDSDYTYVWNKTKQRFEYVERAKLADLGSGYEQMTVAESLDDVKNACQNGGIVYLDKNVVLDGSETKTLSVLKDLVLVGGQNNMVISGETSAVFSVDSDDVTFSLFGVKIVGRSDDDATGTSAGVQVNANNVTVNVYDCDISDCAYVINVRNYANLSYNATKTSVPTFTSQTVVNSDRSVLADDATFTVNVKNSKLSGKACVNWKYVGGTCTLENCTLYSSNNWTLLAVEGNGAHFKVQNCSFVTTNDKVCASLVQCFAKDNVIELTNCTSGGKMVTNDEQMVQLLIAPDCFDCSASEIDDLAKYSGKVGGVYIDLSDAPWGCQTGNKYIVNGETVAQN